MPEIRAESSALIPAPAPVVYGLIADYRRGHPSILPPRYFRNLTVEEGGYGAGTRIRFEMVSFGQVREARASITEPEPGRRLLERLSEDGIETEYVVEPIAGTRTTRVTIVTRYHKPGIRGWLERLLVPPFLRGAYRAEFRLLAERAGAVQAEGAPA
jgi:hypothetical protein